MTVGTERTWWQFSKNRTQSRSTRLRPTFVR